MYFAIFHFVSPLRRGCDFCPPWLAMVGWLGPAPGSPVRLISPVRHFGQGGALTSSVFSLISFVFALLYI